MFKLSFKQQVLAGFTVSLLFVLVSAITSHLSIEKLNDSTNWQSHTYDVINQTKEIEVYVLNSETGIRGFILSGERNYLTPYTKNSAKILPAIQHLKDLVTDNPEQEKKIDSLDFYGHAKVEEMQEVLKANDVYGQVNAAERVMKGKGQFYKNKILEISNKIIEEEYKLLTIRKRTTLESSTQSEWVVLLSAAIIFCLILFLFSYIKRTFDQQKATERHIKESNQQLERISSENRQKNWLLSGSTALNEAMRGEQEIDELARNITTKICNYINAPIGILFIAHADRRAYKFAGGFAYKASKSLHKEYLPGEGLVGQAALEKQIKLLDHISEDYLKVNSGLGEASPRHILALPVVFDEETIAVIELGLQTAPDESAMLYLKTITESIGVGINSALARIKLRTLFEQTQQQAEELESQQEELRTTNEELIYKSEQLQASEEELRVQQEELRQTNAELEEKAQQLEEQNLSVNQAREAMRLKAEELEISGKYKSEFLANMSHELRTPLNSILILARILKENKPANLNQDQIKYAGVIQNAGNDLLTLINDILDLSKIESGKIDLTIEPVKPAAIKADIGALFTELARSKKIDFSIDLSPELPDTIITDQIRLAQIIKNLLSNAFKFTPEYGRISLSLNRVGREELYNSSLRVNDGDIISFSIKDSGIGIPADKQKLIFEAFQQADGSTNRKYGGTGLGLSISKELTNILGGEIKVESEPGVGSTFTLFIPRNHNFEGYNVEEVKAEEIPFVRETSVLPVNTNVKQTLLIIEDDEDFAEVLKDYAEEKGFDTLLAFRGDTGLETAIEHLPDAIVLDIMLPIMDGWTVLKELKKNPKTAHIPVHMMSAGDERADKIRNEGAIGFLKKPVETEQLDQAFELLVSAHPKFDFKTVLVIEDQELQSSLLTSELREKGVEVVQAFDGTTALKLLENQSYDCIILDLNLPDISGFDLLDQIKGIERLKHIPVVINTAMELDQKKMAHIMKHTEAMVLKSNKSNDRLIDEVSLFMNKLKQEEKGTYASLINKNQGKGISTIEKALKGKTILIADDDMRNIFALSSALQEFEINIVVANNGREALEKLQEKPVDLVLMDIMMPEMDGYEATRKIRLEKQWAKLPIIALTAKAMKNDREKCIEAGANDYISKPVDIDQLLSMMRVWLS
jgi:CheY-like chemotaxis protein/signal transduction histidine kinase/CHASE3 domain sensor protein